MQRRHWALEVLRREKVRSVSVHFFSILSPLKFERSSASEILSQKTGIHWFTATWTLAKRHSVQRNYARADS